VEPAHAECAAVPVRIVNALCAGVVAVRSEFEKMVGIFRRINLLSEAQLAEFTAFADRVCRRIAAVTEEMNDLGEVTATPR
jgi:hypothetical protein